MTIGWFVITHRAFSLTRSDRNIKVLKRWGKELNDLFHRHGKISITHKTIIPLRCEHSALDRRALAFFTLDHAQAFMLSRELLRDLIGRVSTSIFNHDHLRGERLLLKKTK